jgi:catechol 2,3-dioxygenase-like lactoylglutathione lyase family enzyme
VTEIAFEGVTPILPVQSLAASIDHYVRVLGFKLDWQTRWFASVTRGRCNLFLADGDQGHLGVWVWIGVSDAGALYEELRAKGAKIRHPPTNYQWAYEMQIADLDGNVLRMGSEPKNGEPIGEWLDMQSNRWATSPDGQPTMVEATGS